MEEKIIKAWVIIPAFPDSKELETCPYLNKNLQFMIYVTKNAAEIVNKLIDEAVVPCEIKILSDKKVNHKQINETKH
jgi:hypothetical protein